MDLELLKVDDVEIENGAWISDIPEMDDLELRVRGFGSKAYTDFVTKRVKALPRNARARDGSVLPAFMKPILEDALVETILLDWRNLKSGGSALPCSKDVAARIIKDPKLRAFRSAVEWAGNAVGKQNGEDDSDTVAKILAAANSGEAGDPTDGDGQLPERGDTAAV